MTSKLYANALVFSALMTIGGCNTMPEGEWNNTKALLQGSPAVKRDVIDDCIANEKAKSLPERRSTAAMVNANLASAPRAFCSRLINAWANGRITYADYVGLSSSSADSSKVIRVIQGR